MLVISREEAIKQGLTKYYTGMPCTHNHLAERRVINRSCVLCAGHKKYRKNTPETRMRSIEYYKKNHEVKLLQGARIRAKKLGICCTITREDIRIPTHCPILGIKLQVGTNGHPIPSSPSLDRVDPTLGYVKENVRVISFRANTIKNNATVPELQAVIDYINSHNGNNKHTQ